MTSAAEARIFRISVAVHLAVILILCAGSLLRGCWSPPRRDMAMFVSIQDIAVVPDVVETPPAPTPPAPTPPTPTPPPEPDIPEPPKVPVKPRPKPVQVSTVRVTRAQAPQPKPAPKPAPRPPTAEELRAALSKGLPQRPAASAGATSDFPFAWYFSLVRKTMYDAWDQPGGLSASSGLRVVVEIRVDRDGTILRREILRPSGHAPMDESVRKAIRQVSKLPPLPDAYSGRTRDIQIGFELTEGVF